MKAFIHMLSEILYKISSVVTGFILVALCLIIDYSVIMRFIFNSPVQWQYELTLVGLCWATFIGMPMTFHMQEHMKLTFVTDRLKPKTWRVYMDVIDVLLIVFLVLGVYYSSHIVKTSWVQYYQTIAIRKGVYYLAFVVGAAFSVVHLIDNILNRKPEDAPILKLAEEVKEV